MNVAELLSVRWRERAELLRRIEQSICNDPRVRASWVMGSVARGEDDALSDLDLFLVVADDAVNDFVENRRIHAANPARPLLLMDNSANAPASGAYLLALYEGEAGPQHVDWYWQAESQAQRPHDGMVLFDHSGIPVITGSKWQTTVRRSSRPPPRPHPSLADLLTNKMEFFWAMSLIAAKFVARRNSETAVRLIGLVTRTLTEATTLHDNSLVPPAIYESLASGRQTAPAMTQLQVLKELAEQAEDVGRQLAVHGVVQPHEAVSQIHRFFELTEMLLVRNVELLKRH